MSDVTITEFLLARWDADETIARDWQHNRLKVEIHGGGSGYERLVNPERVLADIEAKRQAIDAAWADHERIEGEWGMCQSQEQMDAKGDVPDVVRALASVYADHPDYDPSWRI